MRRRLIVLSLVPHAVLAVAACSSASPQCRVGGDCASGACDANGQCVPVGSAHADGGTSLDGAAASGEGGPGADGGAPADATGGGSDAAGLCVPNNDGVIVREEIPMMAGLHANFEIAENVTVDSAGVTNANGTRSWNLTGPYSGDHTVLVTTDAPAGQWFSAQFPAATYTSKLSDTSTLLGIFQGTSSALQMQGVASPSSGTGQTELTYAPPAEALGVPMQLGTSWSSTSNITGTASGLVSDYVEQWTSKVDAVGTLVVPFGTFNVMRVQTTLTRNDLGVVSVTQSLTFVAECFGPIASLTSQGDEAQTEFTNAAEARRLTP